MTSTDKPQVDLELNEAHASRFELLTMNASEKVVDRNWVEDPGVAMQQYVRMTKEDFGPIHGQGSYVALKDRRLELDASRVYEGGGTYRVQFWKDEGMRAFFEAERALTTSALASSPAVTPEMPNSRSDDALNDPMAAAHPELPKAERVMADEQLAQHATLDRSELRRLAIQRAEEAKLVAETLGIASDQAPRSNRIESDEVFTPEQRAAEHRIPPKNRQKHRVEGRFYHQDSPEQVSFEDCGNKLETQSDSEAVAESMVRVAQARGWDEIKVSGSESFRQEVWIEAASRGMQVRGYVPTDRDRSIAEHRNAGRPMPEEADHSGEKARVPNDGARTGSQTIFPDDASKTDEVGRSTNLERAKTFQMDIAPESGTHKHPELASSYAAMAAIERKMEADGLSTQARAIVSQRVRQNIVNSIERGDFPSLSVLEMIEKTRDSDREAQR